MVRNIQEQIKRKKRLPYYKKYPLRQIYFYLTEGCNLKCRHCWLAPKYEKNKKLKYGYFDFNLFEPVIKQAKRLGLRGIKFTGGEPLMHPQITDMMKIANDKGLSFTMETNGILCTEKMAATLKKYKINHISVSLDSYDVDTHEYIRGVKGSFAKTVKGIKNLVNIGINPQMIMTVMRVNVKHIQKTVKFAEKLGCGSIKFNVTQPTERGVRLSGKGETLTIKELVKTGRKIENKIIPESKIRVFYHHPVAFIPLNRIFSRTSNNGCGRCGILGIMGILPDNTYALCGIGSSVPDLVFGGIKNDKLSDIWRSNKIIKEIRKGMPQKLEGICVRCMMKNFCLGSCIAQNYYTYKNLWAPFWYCDEAYKQGLFPETRLFPEKESENKRKINKESA